MTIFKTYWKIVKKNIGIIILYTVMLLVFGTMNLKANKNSFEFISSKPDIIIVNNSSGIITDNLISYLKTNANVKNITDENDIDDAVFFRDANYVIYIPKEFENKIENGKEFNIDIKTNNSYDSYIASELLNKYLDVFSKYMNLYNDKILAIQKLDNTLNKKADVVIENKTSLNSKTSLFYNFSSYSIMAIVIYIICLVLSSFNDEKISKRTSVSGMNYKTFNNYLYISSFTFTFIIFIVYLITVFIFALYRFFSLKVENREKLYSSLDNILDESSQNVELPDEMIKFSEKLNKIKYEYALSKKMAKEAEQKKNDLIMYMAHDLKTPLTSVIGYLSLLNEEKEISKELQEKYIKIALNKSLRLEELTNQFFEITRYNLKDMPITRTKIDLVMLMEQLVEEFYPMLEERHLKLKVAKPDFLMYSADGDKLARAFGNLLRNAISYSYENTTIKIKLFENENDVKIIFENEGATIPEYKLEKIFDKFYRGDEARQTNNGGTGLGLAITKEIVELHNGTINATSSNETIKFEIILKK